MAAAAGFSAFRESYMNSATLGGDSFGDFAARRSRYTVYWAFYENTAYRNSHAWALRYKTEYGLYRYIRNIYNPAYRLGDFWQTHLLGGELDPAAGDGKHLPSAIPIVTPLEQKPTDLLRAAIAQLWKDSNWQTNKDILTLYGAVLGDVGLQVVDDVEKQKVYLKIVHPGLIKSLTLDELGNVKAYEFEEQRPDPRGGQQSVTYTEQATNDGGTVSYKTLLNNVPYAWNGKAAEWEEDYGFVPLVFIKHNDVGLDWGWSELHPGKSKIHEVDDLASKIDDYIRKKVESPMLLAGVKKPEKDPQQTSALRRVTAPEPGREELPFFYSADPNAKAISMVSDLNIGDALAQQKEVLSEIERDYPELQMDIWTAGSGDSGRALRVARQRTEVKVNKRRPNYDNALVRAQQMAVSIGGMRRYEPYQAYSLESYAQGDLLHSIPKRPIFATDPIDEIESDFQFWRAAGQAVTAGVDITVFLELKGWDDDKIKLVTQSPFYQAKLKEVQAKLVGQPTTGQPNEATPIAGKLMRAAKGQGQ